LSNKDVAVRARKPPDSGRDAPSPYRHPVPEAPALLDALRRIGVPVTLAALAAEVAVAGERPLAALRRRLRGMAGDGQLLVNRRGEYCLPEKIAVVSGVVSAHRDGFGFLVPDDGGTDVYLSAAEMRDLMEGDRVAVRVTPGGRAGRRAGAVVEILARGRDSVVGHYRREHGVGYVVATGKAPVHFVVPDRFRGGAEPGDLVRLAITEYPAAAREAQGHVTRVLGNPADPRVLTDAAIETFNLPWQWSPRVESDAEAFGTGVVAADHAGRTDVRDLPLVTIDGEDARDFDDAVCALPDGQGGYRLVVAIADVSHYVQPGSAIDGEARRRGTSVYFPDRVVPMLPEVLSNGLCSLKPAVDRLCMVCDLRLDARGRVTGSRFYRAVMHSRARLTYTQVQAWRDGAPVPVAVTALATELGHLYGAYALLAAARADRGALDLDLPETRVVVDATGRIRDIEPRYRCDAHRLIEECMIAANVEAGRFLRRHRLPTLFRVHAGPEERKFEDLRLMLQGLGFAVSDVARRKPGELNRILAELRSRPDFALLATAVLRSMSQAVYQPANAGHFGLALGCYTHFTSPIRRYPDLLVHRGIAHVLARAKPGAFPYDGPAMEQLGRSTSDQERRADEATRYVEARCKCLVLADRVGEEFDGIVSGVTAFGLFVTLRDIYADGLVHVTSLPSDYYHLEPGATRLVGERTRQAFGLGQELRVVVRRVDTDAARVDLELAGVGLPPPRRGPRPPRRRSA
jgi:ribonuclease R